MVETVPVPMPAPDADEPLDTAEDTRCYLCIDLKTFYASVECADLGLDPFTTNLVVADPSRGNTTICLAITPALKKLGIRNRCRVFEIPDEILATTIMARPRMRHYMEVSAKIYGTYLEYVSPSDIHPYSIDECFIDATPYLGRYGVEPRAFAEMLMARVRDRFSICATAGIGPNLYLCKVAMDIQAKHTPADEHGVRIAELDEMSYRRLLWDHRPLTDFWRVGRGYEKKLASLGLYTMGDIARCSLQGEELLYDLFGVNAELLIDHAWGWESCTMADIKAYRPTDHSVGSGQVLTCPYEAEQARLVVREMADTLSLDLVDKGLVTDQIVLTVGYDRESLNRGGRPYLGPVTTDPYGRRIPKHAHGSENLGEYTSSTRRIVQAALALYDRIVDTGLLVRRIYLTAAHVVEEGAAALPSEGLQLDLFTDQRAEREKREAEASARQREKRMQEALLDIKRRYGKNAVLKGMNFLEGATARDQNQRIGGHQA